MDEYFDEFNDHDATSCANGDYNAWEDEQVFQDREGEDFDFDEDDDYSEDECEDIPEDEYFESDYDERNGEGYYE